MSELYEAEIDKSLFESRFRGRFKGILRWPELDMFWENLLLRLNEQWYIYSLGEVPPDQAASKDQFIEFINEINAFLRKNHKEQYCGVVYVDNVEKPSFVKIFHPRNLGHGICSINKMTPLPGWILSITKPVDIFTSEKPLPVYTRWWKHIVHSF